ncbi:hypothetical protein L6164_015109 [Bauhinia variegata]|uniref:Uncharacterized protein n=1 Tax=Bauhinia variegata TaxID=167791 RepID=A0ACB9NKB6_BAUVA|nr:hypothetical protein L6164_015109 [Bauhinia variegata]
MLRKSDKLLDNDTARLPIIRIREDGRCLFRSLVYGSCLRTGKPAPNESRQKELADDLRAKVVDEFLKRRAEVEWFLGGDFERYTFQMRKPHVWGGEPELLMAAHVLQMPITVFMRDKDSSSLKVIAEYGQEYGKDNPIRVIYHVSGHYDLLQSMQSQLFREKSLWGKLVSDHEGVRSSLPKRLKFDG